MSTKQELLNWITAINSGSNVTDVGLVVDPGYDERNVALDSYLGITVDPLTNIATVDYDTSDLKSRVLTTVTGTEGVIEW